MEREFMADERVYRDIEEMDVVDIELQMEERAMREEMGEEEKMETEFLYNEESEKNLDDDSIYMEDIRDQLLEDDELTPGEVGFMQGYDEAYV